MIGKIGLVCLIAGIIQGCSGADQWGEFRRADRKDLPTINVSGTTYEVFQLSRSSRSGVEAKNDPNATFAVYVVVGKGRKIYCGVSAAGCEAAIRKFNRSSSREVFLGSDH
ncbi:hypothetical protein [uncultured Hoeflea sp.]|uniref:hypothetical protein n=1 Tax=uncultured Hoeflea sp. TaxID=538666 RepID=UPI0030DCF2E2|tara:strand:+ start:2392 stop:2724 length:333 start_codon:yes stop_codon:yes gene_type:complete